MAWPGKIAVVGAGYMGRGIAQVLAESGNPCVLADLSAERAAAAADLLLSEAQRHERDGLRAHGTADRLRPLVSAAMSVEDAVREADLIVEAVFEDRDVKTEVLGAIEGTARPGAVIASNTSAISIGSLSASLRSPERFLGAHWFNPPQFVPGVELIASPRTDPDVVTRVETLLLAAGKQPARVADSPGFVGNRLQYALFQEAVALVEEGVATAETVDAVVRSTFGFRLPVFGPLAIADMAGLDVYRGAYRVLEEAYPERFAAPQALKDLIERGDFGAKTGSGFVIRSRAEGEAMAARRDRAYAAIGRVVTDFERDTTATDAAQ